MIESAEVRKVLRFEIKIEKLMELKDEMHKLKYNNSLNDYPNINNFYESLVNVLSNM